MKVKEWLKKAVFYNIYPQSFYDSNNDGIGDLKGICEKLDYVNYMGFNAIWINPFYESPFNDAGYDVTDFYKVAKRYGTIEDFQKLCKKAHELGIKVCVDLVAGHTSMECEWFKQSQKSKEGEYANRYIWTNDWLVCPENFIAGYGERNGCYMKNFFYCQPALNYGYANVEEPWQLPMNHPDCRKTKQELVNIMEFWIKQGCDGFRVDLADSLIKNDPDKSGIKVFWAEIRQMFDTKYPDCVLISEWSDPAVSIDAGFHVDFLLHTNYPIYTKLFRAEEGRNVIDTYCGDSFFSKDGKGDINDSLNDYIDLYNHTKGRGYISMPTGNHDLPRVSYMRDKRDLELVYVFLLTMPGVPFVYYGDEIGMRYIKDLQSKEGGYTRTGSRTPMQWDSSQNAGFSHANSDKLYLPCDENYKQINVKAQIEDENSLLNIMRSLIKLRQSSEALSADGDVEFLNRENRGYPLVYKRMGGNEEYLICINPSGKCQQFEITLCADVIMQRGDVTISKEKIVMEPTSYAILKLK